MASRSLSFVRVFCPGRCSGPSFWCSTNTTPGVPMSCSCYSACWKMRASWRFSTRIASSSRIQLSGCLRPRIRWVGRCQRTVLRYACDQPGSNGPMADRHDAQLPGAGYGGGHRTGSLTVEQIEGEHEIVRRMVSLAGLTRAAFAAGELSTVMSPRTVINWHRMPRSSVGLICIRLTFLNRCDDAERVLVAELYQRCFGTDVEPT